MNQKILISVKIPTLEQEFDLFIPESKKVGNIKNEIIRVINEQYPDLIPFPEQLSLYERTTATLLRNEMYAKNYIKNGSHLILI